jgi:hypothetical protein
MEEEEAEAAVGRHWEDARRDEVEEVHVGVR